MSAVLQDFGLDYATSPLLAHTGGFLRPGGLELTERLVQSGKLPAGARVLDMACGVGHSVMLLRSMGFSAIGLDCNPGLLRSSPNAPCIRADAMHLPLRSGSLDAVLCECALSLMPDAGALLTEAYRCLASGGAMLLSDLYLRKGEREHDLRGKCCVDGARGRSELIEILADQGFVMEFFEDHTSHLTQLAAELVFVHGSLQAFWEMLLPPGPACEIAGRGSHLGYCIIVARRS